MPTLLSPGALWALAALALPLALHLWRPPPRTVRLGSLRFLPSTARRPLQNLRWRERLLLLARLSLLALLALWLAGLCWQRPPPTRPERWALLDPSAPPTGPSLDRLHALQRAGYQTRFLPPSPDLWSLLRENDTALPPGSTLAVFSPNRLASLRGVRPSLSHCEVEWVQTSAPPTDTKPVAAAHAAPPPLDIVVYHDSDRVEDARYVRAALEAVAKTADRPLNVSSVSPTDNFPFAANTDWIIWLCAEPPPLRIAARTHHLLSEAAAASETNMADWIVPVPNESVSVALTTPVRLWRRETNLPDSAAIWLDATGTPLLTVTREVQLTRWTFASRFHPDWTDLPRTTAFPAFLRSLLLPTTNSPFYADAVRDSRLADPEQCRPSVFHAAIATAPATTPTIWDLHGLLWLLATVVFVLERLLGFQRASALAELTPDQPVFAR